VLDGRDEVVERHRAGYGDAVDQEMWRSVGADPARELDVRVDTIADRRGTRHELERRPVDSERQRDAMEIARELEISISEVELALVFPIRLPDE
jgi:hypothetical protein